MLTDAIIVENLIKTYANGVRALDGVSFSVRYGEIFGLLGPNGAGKSTTVRILATLSQANSGRAVVAGYGVPNDPAIVRGKIGYIAQASGVDRWSTGRENLALQAQLERVPRREVSDRVSRLIEWIGLVDSADRLVDTYSGGMKRRLDIAMGLVHDPEVLFLDEPTTGLDPETRAALWRDLARIRAERNLTVLLTTHYMEEADQLCDRLAFIDQGRVVVTGTPAALKADIRGDTVVLGVNGASGQVADLLRPLDGVLEVIPNGRAVTARVTQGATALPRLITVLERAGIGVEEVTLGRPTLDDVYLHHTGHRFDTGAPDAGSAAYQPPEQGR